MQNTKTNNVKISTSGIRGIIGPDFNSITILKFTLSFGKLILKQNPKKNNIQIAIANDGRNTQTMIKSTVIAGLINTGINVIDLNIAPTPTLLFTVKNENIDGGICITASHNDIQWNGLKFVNKYGQFINQTELNNIIETFNNKSFIFPPHNKIGYIKNENKIYTKHINNVIKLANINKIKNQKLKIAIDCVNSSGTKIIKELLLLLNCNVISIHSNTKKNFERNPEPIPQNLEKLENIVKKEKCNLGFALDPDADRLAIISNKGKAIGEEYTLAIAINHYLKQNKTPIAVNISTSRMIDDIAQKYNAKVYRSPVGELNVLNTMIKHKCQIGGEGNGGVIIPHINKCRDSLISIIMCLNAITHENKSIDELINTIPKYHFIKDKINTNNKNSNSLYPKLLDYYKKQNHNVSLIDGIKINFTNHWIQVRESNTEPLIRIFVEANNYQLAKEKINELKLNINTIMQN